MFPPFQTPHRGQQPSPTDSESGIPLPTHQGPAPCTHGVKLCLALLVDGLDSAWISAFYSIFQVLEIDRT